MLCVCNKMGADGEVALRARRKYKLISHPWNSSPFAGAFLNFVGTIQVCALTVRRCMLHCLCQCACTCCLSWNLVGPIQGLRTCHMKS